ncbi:MAG: tetratricopeptide repeat protein [Saprospiraceae bacterium]|nr:tetratricopeptide repeat protein [Saprospiraceae bacterium]
MLRKHSLCVGLMLCIKALLCAQTTPTDSLRALFQRAQNPIQKAERYFELAELALKANPADGLAYADTLEQLAKAVKHPLSFGRAMHLRGQSYYEQGKFEASIPFFRKELNIAVKAGELDMQGKALNSIGASLQNIGRYDSAFVYLIEAAKIKETLGNMKDVAAAYANIGNVFSDMKAPDKAIEWLEKALAIRLNLPDGERGAIVTYNNISIAYNGKEDYDKAIEYAQKGFDLAMETGNKFHAGVLAGSLGHLWLQKKNPDQAIQMSEKAISLLREVNRRSNLVFPLANLAEAYRQKGNYVKALDINNEGYAIMEELELVEPLGTYYENYAKLYESIGDYKQGFFWLKKQMVYEDSLFNKEKLSAIAEAEAQFENQKKEAQLAKQQLELERQANQKKNILISAGGAILLLIGVFQYLRSRLRLRRREAELAAQLEHAEADKLRELNQIKSSFFANISHEFRTPLTLLLSPLEQMMNGDFKGDFQKYYRIMHRNGKRLLDLVNQLLDLSQLESGKLSLQASEDDLGQFISAVAQSFESLADRKQIDLHVQIPEAPLIGFFDRDKVEKIVANLVSNAFKFTPDGGRVTVAVRENSTFMVQDNGIGIPAEQMTHLFERFYFTTESDLQTGSGLGLALTKELVELHGGAIHAVSEEGKGTTFTVTIRTDEGFFNQQEIVDPTGVVPVGDDGGDGGRDVALQRLYNERPDNDQTPRPDAISPVFETAGKPTLLIVEDNADVRAYIKDQFAGQYQIREAENGRIGLEIATDTTPDLIITDIMMPVMDGAELCRRLKTDEKTSHIPIIMLTARAEQADKIEGLQTGADDYLAKPFDAAELQVRAANLVEQRRKLQAHYRRTLTAFATAEIAADSMDAAFLQQVRAAVEAGMEDENFSVVELGAQIGMSRSQLHRKLSALTGHSPNEVIRNMRLERAKQLLEKKAATASEAAYMCGFSSPGYFSKCFKDYFGVLPSEV